MPRYWELAEPFGADAAGAVDGRRLLVGEAKAASRPLAEAALRFPW